MLLLRVGRISRWAPDRAASITAHVDQAAIDLRLAPGETGLSVFRADDAEEQHEVAIRFSLICRDWPPDHLDYVVFPADLATTLGLSVSPMPRDDLDLYLSDRHHEIIGLTPELTQRLASAILAYGDRQVERLPKRHLPSLAAEVCRRDPEIRKHLAEGWAAGLAPFLDAPAPGD
jgi:hypothetical protein